MTPANGHANDSANIPTTAVQQIAPPTPELSPSALPTLALCSSEFLVITCIRLIACLAISRN
jgi:hypothetical protein